MKYKAPFSMDYREWRSYARSVYPSKDSSRMVTTKVKQEEEADTRVIARE